MTHPPSAGRFRRAATEFVLIVTGVSVALGAQSLWDFGQDRDAEREYLSQLQSDLAENQRRLRDALELEEQQAAAAQAALNALAAGAEVPADSAQVWLMERRGLFYSDPRPITGTFSALVETGDLRLIRDSEKRNAIISYLAQIGADKTEFDRFVDDHLFALRIIRAAGSAPAQSWGSLWSTSSPPRRCVRSTWDGCSRPRGRPRRRWRVGSAVRADGGLCAGGREEGRREPG